ncbi:MAG: hypothetical protein IPK00_18345 [Deltaproteobacteria bacterium]|nr:hypothetical protein [Deltaproteobacteria bacterium]
MKEFSGEHHSFPIGLGLLPSAPGSGDAGHEIKGPTSVVILGGLASSTLLNLRTLPALALLIIGEVRFEPMTWSEASLFFPLVSYRYGRGSILIARKEGGERPTVLRLRSIWQGAWLGCA